MPGLQIRQARSCGKITLEGDLGRYTSSHDGDGDGDGDDEDYGNGEREITKCPEITTRCAREKAELKVTVLAGNRVYTHAYMTLVS